VSHAVGGDRSYVMRAFGDRLGEVREAMEALAASLQPEGLNRVGFRLYERFRPDVPTGAGGWGAKGELRIERIHSARGWFMLLPQVCRNMRSETQPHADDLTVGTAPSANAPCRDGATAPAVRTMRRPGGRDAAPVAVRTHGCRKWCKGR
jgi:hypothetical protein